MERARNSLGPDHPITLGAAAAVAISLARLGATEQAQTLGGHPGACPKPAGSRPPDHPRLRAGTELKEANDTPPPVRQGNSRSWVL